MNHSEFQKLKKIPEIGTEMYDMMVKLYPIFRSITGDGVRKTLKFLPKDSSNGLAAHSLRAVGQEDFPELVTLAGNSPIHMHLAEQVAEVEEVLETPDDGFWHMHAMIPIGYPMGNWGIAQRKPANLSTFQDRWDNPVSWEIPEPLWPNS